MKNLTMKQAFALFKRDLKVLDYDLEKPIEEIVREWWAAQFGCSNSDRESELVEMYRKQ